MFPVRCGTSKNIARTLAFRHQYLETYIATQVSSENIVTTGCRTILFEHLPEMVRSHIVDCGPARDNVVVLKSIAKDGFVYSEGCALVQSVSEDDHPQFAQVCELFCVNKRIVVPAYVLNTIEFEEHFHLYTVNVTGECVVLTNLHHLQ